MMYAFIIGCLLVPIVVLVVEGLARLWIRLDRRYYVFAPRTKLELYVDEETHPQLERKVVFEVNSDGERGPRFIPRPSTFRILVAGGSAAECYFLDQQSAWPAQLQARLSEPAALAALGASYVHVGSIARSGIHSSGLELTLKHVLPRYERLDLIILMVGAGDVLQWMIQGAPSSGLPPSTAERCFVRHPETSFGASVRTSGIAELMRRSRGMFSPHVVRRYNVGRWIGRVRAMRATATDIRRELPDAGVLLADYERNLRAAVEYAKTRARQVLVVRQPWFEKESFTEEERKQLWCGGVGDIMHQPVTTFYSDEVLFAMLRKIDVITSDVAAQAEVDQLELMSVVAPSLVNYYDHFHHTAAGARTIADAVARKTIEMSHPREVASPRTLSTPATQTTRQVPG